MMRRDQSDQAPVRVRLGQREPAAATRAAPPPGRLRGRRWCIPSAILRAPGEALEGVRILHEVDGALGMLLWDTVRDVELWAATADDARPGLFVPAGTAARRDGVARMELPEPLAAPLDTLTALLSTPEHADEEVVSICCLEVAAWAREGGARHTATAFAQAGALASPRFAEAAVLTGQCALEAEQPERAETWLWRAIAVARHERNGDAYAAAYVLLGVLYESRREPRAERYFRQAFRAGRRFAAPHARRDAAHGLFRLARDRGDLRGAEQFALAAQRAYRAEQPGAAGLLLELARFWMDAGQPARARAALRRLAPRVAELSPSGALAAAALIARAAATESRTLSTEAERRAWSMMPDESADDAVAFAATLDLAHAAALRGDRDGFDRAARAAQRRAPVARYAWTRDTLAALSAPAFPRRGIGRAS